MKRLLHDTGLLAAAKTDEAVFEQLLPEFEDLVWFCYWRYFGGDKRLAGTSLTSEDIFQEGMYGLLKALKRYDSRRGTNFGTYAVPYVTGEMLRRFREMRFAFHVSRAMYDAMGDQVVTNEIDVLRRSKVRSFSEIVYDNEKGGGLSLEEIFPAADWEESALDRCAMQEWLSKLSPRDAKIVRLRMAGYKQQEIARQVGTSQANVSRILVKAKKFQAA